MQTHPSNTAEAGELRAGALACLLESDPTVKTAAVADLTARWQAGAVAVDVTAAIDMTGPLPGSIPGRPARPLLVAPRLVWRRSMVTVEGRAMLIHALAHIEFNAMKLSFTH